MKKIIIALVLAIVLVLALASLASANGGPHGGYSANTDACAGCHRTHTASAAKLLVSTSTTLCYSCHGSSATGAQTNVEDGVYEATAGDDTGTALLGGGFVNTINIIAGGTTPTTVTSAHDLGATAAWGAGTVRGDSTTASVALGCEVCHDPHGSVNYRLLKPLVNTNAVTAKAYDTDAGADASDEFVKSYTTESWGTGQSSLCAACHGAYHITSAGSGSDAAVAGVANANGGYTHRVDMAYNYGGNADPENTGYTDASANTVTVPLAWNGVNAAGDDDILVCQTCHNPHGTAAAMNDGTAGTVDARNATTGNDSALLRLDNRAACEACHQK